MEDPDRFRLLGKYQTPRFRIGQCRRFQLAWIENPKYVPFQPRVLVVVVLWSLPTHPC
jgi:hypothetical protein